MCSETRCDQVEPWEAGAVGGKGGGLMEIYFRCKHIGLGPSQTCAFASTHMHTCCEREREREDETGGKHAHKHARARAHA